MFSTTINIQPDIITLSGGKIYAVMYGQLLAAYTPSSGPSSGVSLPALSWVYLTTGNDYAATSAGANVSSFAEYTTAGNQSLTFPSVNIQSAHILFGLGELPAITADPTGAPQQPSPIGVTSIYDFVEFTYDLTNTLYLNTTMIDQFGFPIQIQLNPATPVLPNGAGVIQKRSDVFKNYATYMAGSANSAYLQCIHDPFGNEMQQRILSPKYAVFGNGVSGVVANTITGTNPPASTLPAGTYYYAVTALNANGDASYAQYNVVSLTLTADTPVNIAWAPNVYQPAGTNSYNVYRGSVDSEQTLSWVCIGNVLASTFPAGAGGALADLGQAAVSGQPDVEFNPLVSAFDDEITTFFETYLSTNSKPVMLTLTATDGSTNGYVYTFQGNSVYASGTTTINNFQLNLISVTDSSGKTVSSPPIPLQTAFNIYYPFWNTNTFNSNNPAPPSWTVYPNDTPSVMVLAAQGVFADNAAQPVPPGVDGTKYGVLLGALENQIVAAITRGIANLPGNPQNWGNGTAPTQIAPTLASGTGTLAVNTPYYYIITAVNANGETYGSFEFTATPVAAADSPSSVPPAPGTVPSTPVQINWLPFSTTQAISFNIYRGTASMQENVLVANVTNNGKVNSYIDTGAAGTTQSPPMYFPAGVPSSAYDAFFHQTSISINGAAYAGPYDDQGGQSSTISVSNPVSMSISLGVASTSESLNTAGSGEMARAGSR